MLFFIRAVKGYGGNQLYARLRNNSGAYWDFVALSWVNSENADTKVWLDEIPEADPLESLYVKEAVIPPGGPWMQEAVDDNTGSVLGYDSGVMGELEAIPSTGATWIEKLEFLFQYLALKRDATSTLETMYKDDGSTVLGISPLSDDGSKFTKNKVE